MNGRCNNHSLSYFIAGHGKSSGTKNQLAGEAFIKKI
jgi:hypothetical protein